MIAKSSIFRTSSRFCRTRLNVDTLLLASFNKFSSISPNDTATASADFSSSNEVTDIDDSSILDKDSCATHLSSCSCFISKSASACALALSSSFANSTLAASTSVTLTLVVVIVVDSSSHRSTTIASVPRALTDTSETGVL